MTDETGTSVVQLMTWLLSGMAVSVVGFVGVRGFSADDSTAFGATRPAEAAARADPIPRQIAMLRPVARMEGFADRHAGGVTWAGDAMDTDAMADFAAVDDPAQPEEIVTRGASTPMDRPAGVVTVTDAEAFISGPDSGQGSGPDSGPDSGQLSGRDLDHNSGQDLNRDFDHTPEPRVDRADLPGVTAPLATAGAQVDGGPDPVLVALADPVVDSHDHAIGTPAATSLASAHPGEPCIAELQQVAGRTRIYFDEGSSAIPPQGRLVAGLVARMIRTCPAAQVTVLGFTDPTGNPSANLSLSWQRARNVYDTLAAQGVPKDQIQSLSHMEDHGADCQHFDVVDRRVEFVVTERAGGRG